MPIYNSQVLRWFGDIWGPSQKHLGPCYTELKAATFWSDENRHRPRLMPGLRVSNFMFNLLQSLFLACLPPKRTHVTGKIRSKETCNSRIEEQICKTSYETASLRPTRLETMRSKGGFRPRGPVVLFRPDTSIAPQNRSVPKQPWHWGPSRGSKGLGHHDERQSLAAEIRVNDIQ